MNSANALHITMKLSDSAPPVNHKKDNDTRKSEKTKTSNRTNQNTVHEKNLKTPWAVWVRLCFKPKRKLKNNQTVT